MIIVDLLAVRQRVQINVVACSEGVYIGYFYWLRILAFLYNFS